MQRLLPSPKFDFSTHTYTDPDSGEILISSTQALKEAGIASFGNVNQDILQRAARFGTATHFATFLDDHNNLDEASCHASIMDCVVGWRKFKKDFNVVILLNETRLLSRRFKFAGTPDRVVVVKVKDYFVLPDLKSGVKAKWHPLQTASYKILVEENYGIKIRERWGLYLKEKNYSIEPHEDRNDRHKFLEALKTAKENRKNAIQPSSN